MSRKITVEDLPVIFTATWNGDIPFLRCDECGMESSANKGDYLLADQDTPFRCCGRNMR